MHWLRHRHHAQRHRSRNKDTLGQAIYDEARNLRARRHRVRCVRAGVPVQPALDSRPAGPSSTRATPSGGLAKLQGQTGLKESSALHRRVAAGQRSSSIKIDMRRQATFGQHPNARSIRRYLANALVAAECDASMAVYGGSGMADENGPGHIYGA